MDNLFSIHKAKPLNLSVALKLINHVSLVMEKTQSILIEAYIVKEFEIIS